MSNEFTLDSDFNGDTCPLCGSRMVNLGFQNSNTLFEVNCFTCNEKSNVRYDPFWGDHYMQIDLVDFRMPFVNLWNS
jgi:hypothetical protein